MLKVFIKLHVQSFSWAPFVIYVVEKWKITRADVHTTYPWVDNFGKQEDEIVDYCYVIVVAREINPCIGVKAQSTTMK